MKILFVNPFGIGDVLFTTPLIRPLKERGDSVYYWCNERVDDILKYNKSIDTIFPLSRGDLKKIFKASPIVAAKKTINLIKMIKNEKFDIVLDFSMDYRYSLLLRFLGVKEIVGFDYKGRGRFLTDKVRIEGFNNRHMAEHYAGLLKFIDKEIRMYDKMELFVGLDEKKRADKILRSNGVSEEDILIGIVPGGGASWGESAFIKQWPKEKFIHIAKELEGEKRKIILFGSREEAGICNFISGGVRGAVNMCGKTTLGEFAALLERCRVLITNDGGPLHMASALGVKTVSIFGPVDEKVYGPYPPSSEHIAITSAAKCRPCYKNFKYEQCNNRKCLDSIDASSVLEAVRSRL